MGLAAAAVQFGKAANMTDRFAALSSIVNAEKREQGVIDGALKDFFEQYRSDTNVMDQWLSVQSSSPKLGTLEHIKTLMEQDVFDATSPNKLRALVGGFISNMSQFHAGNGEGYEFLAELLIELDRKNPQIAARMMTPLTRWRKYEPGCRERMRKALESIKAVPDLSTDVYEVVTKSL